MDKYTPLQLVVVSNPDEINKMKGDLDGNVN